MIVTIGTNDTLASPGAQLDYYQSVIDKMGRERWMRFARLFVMPQSGHGLSGHELHRRWRRQGDRRRADSQRFDRFGVLIDWVEKNVAPAMR